MKKKHLNSIAISIFTLLSAFTLSACAPEPGSKAWCNSMNEKSKTEWTADQAGIYTKHCVLGNYKE